MWACDGLTGHLFAAFGTENHRHIKTLCFDKYMIIYHKNICKGKIVVEIKNDPNGSLFILAAPLGLFALLTTRKARTARKVLRLFLPTIVSNLRFSSGGRHKIKRPPFGGHFILAAPLGLFALLTTRKARTARKVLRLFLPTIVSNLRFSSGD